MLDCTKDYYGSRAEMPGCFFVAKSGDIWAFSKIEIEVVDEHLETIHVFDNYADAHNLVEENLDFNYKISGGLHE